MPFCLEMGAWLRDTPQGSCWNLQSICYHPHPSLCTFHFFANMHQRKIFHQCPLPSVSISVWYISVCIPSGLLGTRLMKRMGSEESAGLRTLVQASSAAYELCDFKQVVSHLWTSVSLFGLTISKSSSRAILLGSFVAAGYIIDGNALYVIKNY